jgi:hypothetical protein
VEVQPISGLIHLQQQLRVQMNCGYNRMALHYYVCRSVLSDPSVLSQLPAQQSTQRASKPCD